MEWTESIRRAIEYMEKHLLEDISATEISETVYISPFYLQKGFKMMTGYTLGEYIRGRRLYMAALDVIANKEKIIDLAYKYGYDTPESFTKAFSRFHGVSPKQIQGDVGKIKTFLSLRITISIKGGNEMDYVIEKMDGMKIIGFVKEVPYENSYNIIPSFWRDFCSEFCNRRNNKQVQNVIEQCCIGEFGVCISDINNDKSFKYIIAGKYNGGEVPEGMEVFNIPSLKWAKFKCIGPMPEALQAVNTRVFNEWIPGNPEYEISEPMNIEWYSKGDGSSTDYESEIWVPVKRK